jgi:hypothetical protein
MEGAIDLRPEALWRPAAAYSRELAGPVTRSDRRDRERGLDSSPRRSSPCQWTPRIHWLTGENARSMASLPASWKEFHQAHAEFVPARVSDPGSTVAYRLVRFEGVSCQVVMRARRMDPCITTPPRGRLKHTRQAEVVAQHCVQTSGAPAKASGGRESTRGVSHTGGANSLDSPSNANESTPEEMVGVLEVNLNASMQNVVAKR